MMLEVKRSSILLVFAVTCVSWGSNAVVISQNVPQTQQDEEWYSKVGDDWQKYLKSLLSGRSRIRFS
jgi:hypothetical protein